MGEPESLVVHSMWVLGMGTDSCPATYVHWDFLSGSMRQLGPTCPAAGIINESYSWNMCLLCIKDFQPVQFICCRFRIVFFYLTGLNQLFSNFKFLDTINVSVSAVRRSWGIFLFLPKLRDSYTMTQGFSQLKTPVFRIQHGCPGGARTTWQGPGRSHALI